MRNIVVWSGGCDSTLVLHNLAKLSSKESPVIAISIDWKVKLHPKKVIKEKEVRKNYLVYAKRKGYHIKNYTVTISSALDVEASGHGQLCLWICAILPFIKSNDNVHFGYHEGDTCWSGYTQVYRIFENICFLRNLTNVSVKYPLEYKSKNDILQELDTLKIPKKCFWWCEDPISRGKNIRMCGKCNPCITHKLALYERKIR